MPTVTVIQPKVADDIHRLLRVAAYCRVSSNSDDQLNSYSSQLTYYTHKFEDSETETLIDIYADEGITGTSEEKRTEFLRLIDDCRKGKIDRVYTKSISRFARNTRDCLKNIRELKSLGITIMFEKENIDTANINDELMITIMGGLAQEESVSISKNMKWSIHRRMRNGSYTPHSAPYGYVINNRKLVINTDEARIVKEIYSIFLKGNGTQNVAEYINNKYCLNPPLAVSTVRYILTNEKYTGDSLYQKTFTPDIIGSHHRVNKGEREMYYVNNTHESIISKEEFNNVQLLLKSRADILNLKKKDILSGKVFCGSCGKKYIVRGRKDRSYLTCIIHFQKAKLCNSCIIYSDRINDAFIRLFNKVYQNYRNLIVPILNSMQEYGAKRVMENNSILELRRSLLQLKEQLNVIATLRTKGFFNESKYKEQSNEITVKIHKLNKDIRLLSQSDDTLLKDIETLIDYFAKREHIMIEFEPEAFEFLIDKIVVNGGKLEFYLVGGLIFAEIL